LGQKVPDNIRDDLDEKLKKAQIEENEDEKE
jgi:ParB-like chromosome segregation protein Spo0J